RAVVRVEMIDLAGFARIRHPDILDPVVINAIVVQWGLGVLRVVGDGGRIVGLAIVVAVGLAIAMVVLIVPLVVIVLICRMAALVLVPSSRRRPGRGAVIPASPLRARTV